jgi:hypothetical protein
LNRESSHCRHPHDSSVRLPRHTIYKTLTLVAQAKSLRINPQEMRTTLARPSARSTKCQSSSWAAATNKKSASDTRRCCVGLLVCVVRSSVRNFATV